MPSLRFGQAAPDFSLPSTDGSSVSLVDFRGRADIVLAVVLGISGDSPFCHDAFRLARNVPFPLLSDVHRAVIRAYGVLDEDRNVAFRSTFIVDRDGMLRWGQSGDREMVRDGVEILRVLDLVAALRRR